MNIIDLFAGIGGFSIAAHMAGHKTIAFVENDKYCHKLLQKRLPNAEPHTDIKTFNGKPYKGKAQIIAGGFPCQPISIVGNRKGQSDGRWLWPEMYRIITEVKPYFCIIENVPGLISMDDGRAFEGILTDLENEGYKTETYIIPAASIGAWHERDRVWIFAYGSTYSHTNENRWEELESQGLQLQQIEEITSENWAMGGYCRERQGSWQTQPRMGRVADGISNRVDRVGALGNAIVPQVAYQFFKVINALVTLQNLDPWQDKK